MHTDISYLLRDTAISKVAVESRLTDSIAHRDKRQLVNKPQDPPGLEEYCHARSKMSRVRATWICRHNVWDLLRTRRLLNSHSWPQRRPSQTPVCAHTHCVRTPHSEASLSALTNLTTEICSSGSRKAKTTKVCAEPPRPKTWAAASECPGWSFSFSSASPCWGGSRTGTAPGCRAAGRH